MEHITYKDAGVDVDEGARAVDAIKASVGRTVRPEVLGGLGGFGSMFSLAAAKSMTDPILVSGTDGVGTKLALAQRLGRHNSVGQDLVAMCVDDIVCVGAEPLFFLDYIALGKLQAEHVAQVIDGIADGCAASGCALVGGEMAEHPGVMAADDYDLAGFAVGLVDRPKLLGPERVVEGDVIIGLMSSGIHSNGYSLVRAALTDKLSVAELNAHNDTLGESIADALLRPTRIYAKGLLAALEQGLAAHAMAHITGGGITENLNRAMPAQLDAQVSRAAVSFDAAPPIIRLVAEAAGLNHDEALKTFNMGIGMAVVVDAAGEQDALALLAQQGFEPRVIGTVVAGTGQVSYVD